MRRGSMSRGEDSTDHGLQSLASPGREGFGLDTPQSLGSSTMAFYQPATTLGLMRQ